MGYRWAVEAYVSVSGRHYEWMPVYEGQSLIKAIRVARKEKRYMSGAIRITWR